MLREQLEALVELRKIQTIIRAEEAIEAVEGILKEMDEAREISLNAAENRKVMLRSQYKDVTGRDPFMGWGEAELDRRIEDARIVKVEHVDRDLSISFASGDEITEKVAMLKVIEKQGRGRPKKEVKEVSDLSSKKSKWKKAEKKLMKS